MEALNELWQSTGFNFITWRMLAMWLVVGVLLYFAIHKKYEPLLLVPIAFGALLANLPTQGIINQPAGAVTSPFMGRVVEVMVELDQRIQLPRFANDEEAEPLIRIQLLTEEGRLRLGADGEPIERVIESPARGHVVDVRVQEGDRLFEGDPIVELASPEPGGLFYYISQGVHLEIFPPLIFLGVGALTDFGPLIANPRVLLLGAAAQFGVFATFLGAVGLLGFSAAEAGAIGIIGGADGPTSIFLANKLAPELLGPIAVAAYSYMALVPLIQPPIMIGLTTEKERRIRMKSLRKVSKLEKLLFALIVMMFCIIVIPAASALIGMLMLGNFLHECGVVERLSNAARNEIINIVTIFLGVSVGLTMTGDRFLQAETLGILALGIVAFVIATASGVLMAKGMNLISRNKVNPLIGSAGVSAVPMAARVSQDVGSRYDPTNFLLMHAMGPNVAGVIGTAVAAGYFITVLD